MKGVTINIYEVNDLLKITLHSRLSNINTLKNTFDDLMRCLILAKKIIELEK